ncbi:MAG: hypothetical protein JXB05_26590 [Myxococcaceae bacterium]|nr:hypothetical protein [Myxococcaceae bacterium]
MTPWLAISLGLWLGQTPQVTPPLPPDADTQDPAAVELREAWERALEEREATDVGQGQSDEIQMPTLEIGTPESPITVPVVEDPLGTGEDLAAPGIGGAGTDVTPAAEAIAAEATAAEAAPQPQSEVARLRAQVEELQTQLEALQEESTASTERLQQELTGMEERAQELERLREERLELLERAVTWMLAADQALAVGELDVGDALAQVDIALTDVLQNASDAGSGQTVLLVENARTRIAFVAEAVGRRDVHPARLALYIASLELREARRQAFDRPGASTVLP